jgi:hypothetical protein
MRNSEGLECPGMERTFVMPWYRKYGKIQTPMTEDDFALGMAQGKFVEKLHRAFCIGLYYSAVRKTELSRAIKEQFTISEKGIVFSVGKRLKHGIETPALLIPFDAPFVDELRSAIENTEQNKRVFPFGKSTAYNVVARAFKYPHFFRLSRITNFFLEGWTIAQVHSWTGLTLGALDYYLGLVDVTRMGESLGKKAEGNK